MQLKALIRNIAKEKNISAQLVLQNFMLERLLERISISPYRENFILKGGFLVGAMVGLNSRATMDMDITIKGQPVTEETVKEMFIKIINIRIDDDIEFEFKSIGEIREGDDYYGYRLGLTGNFGVMKVPLKLDVTTGDVITPSAIEYSYQSLMNAKKIRVLAYNIETILAEKLEAMISRGDQSTRPRDYYDVYILWKLRKEEVNVAHLLSDILATAKKRGTLDQLKDYRKILETSKKSAVMKVQWTKYQRTFLYAKEVSFDEACDIAIEIMSKLL